jgi:hypothetical protein
VSQSAEKTTLNQSAEGGLKRRKPRRLKAALRADRQKQALQTGLALTSERVEHLKQLYIELQTYLGQAWPVWLADLQREPGAEPVQARAPRFNTAIITQMRGILNDLARETGGRAARVSNGSKPAQQPGVDEGAAPALPDLKPLSAGELDSLDGALQALLPWSES